MGPGDQGGAAALAQEGRWWLEPERVWVESSGWPRRCLPAHKSRGLLADSWVERGREGPRTRGDQQLGQDATELWEEEWFRGQCQAQGWAS